MRNTIGNVERNLRNTLLISYRRHNFRRRLQILKLAKHARFLRDLAQIRTEVDRARGNWQRCAMNAAFTGLRKRGCSSKCSRETMTKKREQIQFTKREEKCVPVSQPEKDNRCAITTREYPWYLLSRFSCLTTFLLII